VRRVLMPAGPVLIATCASVSSVEALFPYRSERGIRP
jgi:hypothetical protein